MVTIIDPEIGGLNAREESAYGTDPGTGDFSLGALQRASISLKKEAIEGYSIGAGVASKARKFVSLTKEQHTVEAEFEVQNWRFLKYVLGKDTVSGTGPYTHTLDWLADPPSMTLEGIIDPSIYSIIVTGCKVDVLTLSGELNAPIVATLTMFGNDQTKNTTPATIQSDDSTEPYILHSSSLSLNSVDIGDRVQSFEWTVSRALEPLRGISSKKPLNYRAKKIDDRIKLTIRNEGVDILDIFTNESAVPLVLTLQKSANEKVVITYSKVKLAELPIEYSIDTDLFNFELEFIPEGLPTVVVTNNVSTAW